MVVLDNAVWRPEAPPIKVALLSPLPIGVVLWHAPQPMLTAIVKTTFSIAEDGVAHLVTAQEALSLDCRHPLGDPDDLERATDFAPKKPRADVLLTGYAYSAVPTSVIAGSLSVDRLQKTFYVVSPEPSSRTPLLPVYLRSAPREDSPRVRVGPRAILSSSAAEAALISRDGTPRAPLHERFDDRLFNVAPGDQQIETLSSTSTLVLDGLVPGGGRRTVRLPGVRPRVFSVFPEDSGERRGSEEIVLRCDTLWIDTGREICTLTWRGVFALSPGRPLPDLISTMDANEGRTTAAAVARRSGDTVLVNAVQPGDPRGGAPDTLMLDAEIRWPRAGSTLVSRGVPAPAIGPALTMDNPPSETIDSGGVTPNLDVSAIGQALYDALPFQGPAGVIPIATYAAIKGAVWGEGGSLSDMLARYGLDDAAWYDAERRLARALVEEAMAGKRTLAMRLREALRAVRDQRPPDSDRSAWSLESYVSLRAAIEGASDPASVLVDRRVGAAAWHRNSARFQACAYVDDRLRTSIRAGLDAARKAGPSEKPHEEPKRRMGKARPPAAARRIVAGNPNERSTTTSVASRTMET